MNDLFDAEIMCNQCVVKTNKDLIVKEGFNVRYSECPRCKEKWYHPSDIKDYEEFKKLKDREFHVKLRMVGNSFQSQYQKKLLSLKNSLIEWRKKWIRL